MDRKLRLKKVILVSSIMLIANVANAQEFKRFSVTAGWMHVMPQGKANLFNINTQVDSNRNYQIGEISQQSLINSLDPNGLMKDGVGGSINAIEGLQSTLDSSAKTLGFLTDNDDSLSNIRPFISGEARLNGISEWQAQGTGLEAKNVDTLGLTFNYYLNDHVSLQFIGGIPPKVDIKGKGLITANMSGYAMPLSGDPYADTDLIDYLNNMLGLSVEDYKDFILDAFFIDGKLDLKQGLDITNLGNKKKASTARAWTPAFEAQYQFGQSGINKFRPFVGAGIMYAHFNDIKLDSTIKSDLINAGHMIQNILDGKAGQSLDQYLSREFSSSADPKVRVKTTDSIAPLVTLGATYDLNSNWYGIASVSYAKLNNRATIDVIDKNTGNKLIHSSTKIDIDPLITYLGVGYRF